MKNNRAIASESGGPPELKFMETSASLAQLLRSFAGSLEQSEVPARAPGILPKVLEYAERLQLKRVSIADGCQVSEATVSRWAAGKVTPHILVAQVAIRIIADLALEKAREYEQEDLRRVGG